MVIHCALILTLFSTPLTEGQSCLPVKGFKGIDCHQSHDLRWFSGRHHLEKLDALWGIFCHAAHGPEVLSCCLHLLDLVDFRSHEASGGGHLLEGAGEVMGHLMVIVRAVHSEICLPSSSDEVGVFSEGFPMALLEKPHRGLPSFHLWWGCSSGVPSFHLWWGCSSGVTASPVASSYSGLSIIASWSDDQHHHLVLVGGAGVLDTVSGEVIDGSSLPTVASCRVVVSMAASGTLPVRSCKGYISTPRALRGQAWKAVPQASTNAWWSCPSSASASCSQLKHTFLIGLFQGVGLCGMTGFHLLGHDFTEGLHLPNCDSTTGLCLLNHGCTAGLLLPNGGCMADFHLFDGLGSLDLILAHCSVSILCKLSLAGLQGGLSCEQLLQGCIHLPLQLKHLFGQVGWIGPGGLDTMDWGDTGHIWSFWHSRWGGWVTDLDDVGDMFQHNHTWGCLWRVGHQIRDGWVHPLQAEWIFWSGRGQSTQGHRQQFPSRHAMLRWALRWWEKSTAAIPRPPGGVGW